MADFTVKEYVVKDKDGKFKVWQSGQLIDYQKWLADKASQVIQPGATTTLVDTGMEEPVLAPPPPQIIKPSVTLVKRFSLEKIVQKLVDRFSLKLTNEAKERFNKLLFSFFRGIRQAIDLRDNLLQSWQDGGMEMSTDQVDELLAVIKEIDKKIKSNNGEVVSVDIEEQKFKQEPQVQAEISKAQDRARQDIQVAVSEQAMKIAASKIAKAPVVDPGKPLAGAEEYVVKEQPAPKPSKGLFFWRKRPQAVPAGKVPMQEIKKFSKLVGPIDELRQLSLNMFRRLGTTPSEIVNKVEERINRLSTGSLAEKDRATKAWQSSPVYNLYVKLGRASLENGLPVETIIQRQLNAGQESLTSDEFEAISDLNSRFRF